MLTLHCRLGRCLCFACLCQRRMRAVQGLFVRESDVLAGQASGRLPAMRSTTFSIFTFMLQVALSYPSFTYDVYIHHQSVGVSDANKALFSRTLRGVGSHSTESCPHHARQSMLGQASQPDSNDVKDSVVRIAYLCQASHACLRSSTCVGCPKAKKYAAVALSPCFSLGRSCNLCTAQQCIFTQAHRSTDSKTRRAQHASQLKSL